MRDCRDAIGRSFYRQQTLAGDVPGLFEANAPSGGEFRFATMGLLEPRSET